jgi:secretion/DNA translocation related TadE-like protein
VLVLAAVVLAVGLASGGAAVGQAVLARHRAVAAADLAALAAVGVTGGVRPCEAAAASAGRNGGRLVRCSVLADGSVEVEVLVDVQGPLRPLPFATGRARAGLEVTGRAAALSSGSLPLPHLGDCTQAGQPVAQGQSRITSRVAVSQRRAQRKPRSANPAPPGCPSCTKIVGSPVSGCRAVDTPPMSQRSQVATKGMIPIAACSAACAAPGMACAGTPAAASSDCGIVHQTAVVRRVRAGRSRGSSPSTSPLDTCRRT